MIIVATELHVRNFWHLFDFVITSARSMKQAKRSAGCICATASNKGWKIGYTLTAWENKEVMLQFRNTGAHKAAMQKIGKLSRQFKTSQWESDKQAGWQEAKKRLDETAFKVLK